MSELLDQTNWNAEYAEQGRYVGEDPIAFVDEIVEHVRQAEHQTNRPLTGLYPGCGNGRNYIPMLRAGLDLHGVDFSEAGIAQLQARDPVAEDKTWVGRFEDIQAARVYDYLTSIQVFQHGDHKKAAQYFKQSHDILRPGGLLFLRVNAVGTQIQHNHEHVQGGDRSVYGRTVLYKAGPKIGQKIHFYSEPELGKLASGNNFEVVQAAEKVIETRADGSTWSQWQAIWRRAGILT